MATIYTRVSDDVNGLIDALVEEEGRKKTEIIRELLEKGLDLQGELTEAKDLTNKALETESLKEAVSGLQHSYTELSEGLRETQDIVVQRLDEFAEAIQGLKANDERHHVKMHELASKVEKNGEKASKDNKNKNPNSHRWSPSELFKKKD